MAPASSSSLDNANNNGTADAKLVKLKDKFAKSVAYIQSNPAESKVTPAMQLSFYGLFKQATVGPNKTPAVRFGAFYQALIVHICTNNLTNHRKLRSSHHHNAAVATQSRRLLKGERILVHAFYFCLFSKISFPINNSIHMNLSLSLSLLQWKAWKDLKTLSSEKAMRRYVRFTAFPCRSQRPYE